MTRDTSTIRLRAGASAVLVFLLTIIAAGLLRSNGVDLQEIERGSVDIIFPIMAANTAVIAIVAWVVVIHSVLIALFGIDLYRILDDGRSGLLFAPVALVGGTGLFIVEVLMLLGISQGLAPVYAGATGAEQTAIEATTQALLLFRSRMLLVAGVLWSLAAIRFGRGMVSSTEFPGWMGYSGYIAGLLGVIGGFFPLFSPLLVFRSLGQFLFVLWVLIAGIMLIRSR